MMTMSRELGIPFALWVFLCEPLCSLWQEQKRLTTEDAEEHRENLLTGILQNFQRRQSSWRAHDSATRVRRRSAHVQAFDWRAEARPSGDRPQEEKLLQRKLSLKDVAFSQPKVAFEVERSQHLLVQNDVLQIRRVLGDGIDHCVAEIITKLVPIQPGPQFVRRVLHEARHHVLPWAADAVSGQRRNHHFED